VAEHLSEHVQKQEEIVSNTISVGTAVIGEAVGGTVDIESPVNGSRKELLPTWFPVGNNLRSRRKAQEHAVLAHSVSNKPLGELFMSGLEVSYHLVFQMWHT
jgi:hypothetical protein